MHFEISRLFKRSETKSFESTGRLRLKLFGNLPQLNGFKLMQVIDVAYVNELAAFERKMMPRTYKFGVLLVRAGQKTEVLTLCDAMATESGQQ